MSSSESKSPQVARQSPSAETSPDGVRIVDLLVWTGCIALCFGWFRLALEFKGVDLSTVETATVEWGLRAVIGGTAITGVFLVGPQVLIQGRRSVSPGEWLWLMLGIEWAARTVLAAGTLLSEQAVTDFQTAAFIRTVYGGGLSLTAAALSFLSAMLVRWVTLVRWECLFLFGCAVYGIEASCLLVNLSSISTLDLYIGVIENHVFKVALLPALLVVVVWDLWCDRAFPWRHWMGGVVFLSGLVFTSSYLLGWP